MNVLIIDDEVELLELLEEALEEKFMCRVDTANNGLDAFVLCQKQKYDVILTDHLMPIMKGSALIIGIRTRENLNQKTPIFMMTALATDGLEGIPELKGVDFIKKPFDLETLTRKFEKFLS